MERTYETPGPVTVRIRNHAGEVVVETEETTQSVVRLEADDDRDEDAVARTRVEMRGNELHVETPEHRGSFGRAPEIEVRVRCPHGSSVQVTGASADIRIQGRPLDVEIQTASGDVEVERAEGRARVGTVSGDARIGVCVGPLEVNTTSGDLTIERAGAGLRAGAVSGDLEVGVADQGVQLNTVSGEVRLAEVGPGQIRGHTVSGDVRVGVRPGCDVRMDVHTLSGEASSELEPADGAGADPSRLVEITIQSVSGEVRIERAAGARSL